MLSKLGAIIPFFFLSVVALQQKCGENCVKCIDESKCDICADGHFKNEFHECVRCAVVGCKHCATDVSECDECLQGFALHQNFTCVQCSVANCAQCDSSTDLCEKCADSFGLVDNECRKCSFSQNCLKCDENTSICEPCPEREGRNAAVSYLSDLCLSCFDPHCVECPQNYLRCQHCAPNFGLKSQSQCSECQINNCQTCDWNEGIEQCIQCQQSHFLSSPFNCTKLIASSLKLFSFSNYLSMMQSIDVQCYEIVFRCRQCTQTQCKKCNSFFGFNDTKDKCLACNDIACQNCFDYILICNKCVDYTGLDENQRCQNCTEPACLKCDIHYQTCTQCDSYFGFDSNKKCFPCSDSNCKNCSLNYTECNQCKEKYGFNSELQCVPCEDKNCFNCAQDKNYCSTCLESHRLNLQNICVPCSGTCKDCQINLNQCRECMQNFGLDSTKQCIKCAVPNCKSCSDDYQMCQSCASHYTLTNVQNCSQCDDPNCLKCNPKITSACTQCEFGYGLDNTRKCLLCSDSNCYECNIDYQRCKLCKDNHAFNESFQCTPCEENCKTCYLSNYKRCSICKEGYYNSNENCEKCLEGCARCVNGTSCQSCNEGYFYKEQKCVKCASHCKTCQNETSCLSCMEGYYLKKQNCDNCHSLCIPCENSCHFCDEGQYFKDQQCIACPSPCAKCTNQLQCEQCEKGFFLDEQKCSPCQKVCKECTTLTSCDRCMDGLYLQQEQCLKCPSRCATCHLNLNYSSESPVCLSCATGFQLNTFDDDSQGVLKCVDICGDQIAHDFCDNQPNVPLDGCDNQCNQMENFTCEIDNLQTYCSYKEIISFDLVQINFVRAANKREIIFEVQPPLYAFQIIQQNHFMNLFTIIPENMQIRSVHFHPESNYISFICEMVEVIENEEKIEFLFLQSESQSRYFNGTPQSSIAFPIEEDMFRYFPKTVENLFDFLFYLFYFITVLGWVAFFLSTLRKSLVGIEAMFVLQFAFVVFLYSSATYQHPFPSAFALKYSMGFNIVSSESIQKSSHRVPPFVSQNDLGMLFRDNFNLMFILLNVPPVFCVLLYCRLLQVIKQVQAQVQMAQNKEKIEQQNSTSPNIQLTVQEENEYNENGDDLKIQNAEEWFSFSVQIAFSCCLVTVINILVASAIHFTSTNITDPLSMFFFVISVLIVIVYLVTFYNFPFHFGYFKLAFKKDSVFSLNHVYFFLFSFVCAAILAMFFNKQFPFIPAVPLGILLAFTLIRQPYSKMRHNFRSCYNIFVSCVLVSFNVLLKYQYENFMSFIVPIFTVLTLMIFSVVVVAIAFLIFQFSPRKNDFDRNEQLQIVHKIKTNDALQRIIRTDFQKSVFQKNVKNCLNKMALQKFNIIEFNQTFQIEREKVKSKNDKEFSLPIGNQQEQKEHKTMKMIKIGLLAELNRRPLLKYETKGTWETNALYFDEKDNCVVYQTQTEQKQIFENLLIRENNFIEYKAVQKCFQGKAKKVKNIDKKYIQVFENI